MKQNDDIVSWANITSPSSIIYIKGSILKKNLLLLGSKQAYTAISEYKENNVIFKKKSSNRHHSIKLHAVSLVCPVHLLALKTTQIY